MKDSRGYLSLIHKLPCVVHLFSYGKIVRAHEAHHIEFNRGDHSDFATIPICGVCHDRLHDVFHRRAFYRAHKLDDVKVLAYTSMLVYGYLTAADADRESGRWALRFMPKGAGTAP